MISTGEAGDATETALGVDTKIDGRTFVTQVVPSGIPSALERSEIPLYFRQFKNAAVLKKLAHTGKGPLYQLIGKNAWYETADIVAWLSGRKRAGPSRALEALAPPSEAPPRTSTSGKRRGRPTKAALWLRKQEKGNPAK
jgi:hypothetical protein